MYFNQTSLTIMFRLLLQPSLGWWWQQQRPNMLVRKVWLTHHKQWSALCWLFVYYGSN